MRRTTEHGANRGRAVKNRYVRRAKISEAKFRQFLRYFALDMEATKIAVLARLNRNTVNRLAKAVRHRIAEQCKREAALTLRTAVHLDAWPPQRPDAARRFGGRLVLGWVMPDGRVHTQLVPNLVSPYLSQATPIAQSAPLGPINVSVAHTAAAATSGQPGDASPNRVKILDNFLGLAKLRLGKFKGTSGGTFHLHLKECEFRFNHRNEDRYHLLLALIRGRPLC